jgi:5-formyltetrahydrofolate cyclo-ligase
MTSKRELRTAMLARRRLLTPVQQASCGSAIRDNFLALDAYIQATSILLYLAVNGEAPTDGLLDHALNAGKKVCLPVTVGESILLRRYSGTERLITGRYGILEPSEECLTVDPQSVDLFVVPGVVFDLSGNRGGYGKGYYDRLLSFCGRDSVLAGLCYDFQLVDELKAEPHDVRMDMVITERRVISLR